MASSLLALLHAYLVFALALISPGPDFAVTLRTSVAKGRRAGWACAAGVASANAIHILLVRLGVGKLVAGSPLAYRALVGAAAAFLAYLGVQALLAPWQQPAQDPGAPIAPQARRNNAFLEGFLVNILNGKAILFWLSFFALVLQPGESWLLQLVFPIFLVVSIFSWFAFVATVMSQPRIRAAFYRHEQRFHLVMGVLLLCLALRVAASFSGII
jgi:threonine/homoserine/homoserine lactone efflux protein